MNRIARRLIDRLWADYTLINPWAERLRAALRDGPTPVAHDHVALRTVSHPQFGIARTARPFEQAGYRLAGEYHFPSKRLLAQQYTLEGSGLPDILISELQLHECSRGVRDMIGALARGVDHTARAAEDFALGGLLWNPILHEVYDRLRAESKQAAWFAAFGFRAHRFAVLLDSGRADPDPAAIQARLERHGLATPHPAPAGTSGDAGFPLARLSTAAIPTRVAFADGISEIPGVRDAFVWREAGTDGRVFRGFLDERTPPPGISPA